MIEISSLRLQGQITDFSKDTAFYKCKSCYIPKREINSGFAAILYFMEAKILTVNLKKTLFIPFSENARNLLYKHDASSLLALGKWRGGLISIFLPWLDSFLSNLKERFSKHKMILSNLMVLLPSGNFTTQKQLDDFHALLSFYHQDVAELSRNVLDAELRLWYQKFMKIDGSSVEPPATPKCAIDALNACNAAIYPNIFTLLKIFATIPISTATAERTFSTLRRLKVLLEDININILENNYISDNYLAFMGSCGFCSYVNCFTRVQEKSKSCIDHIFIKDECQRFQCKPFVLNTDISDPIEGELLGVYESSNVNLAVDAFLCKLTDMIECCTNKLKISKKDTIRNPWISKRHLKDTGTKYKLYSQMIANPTTNNTKSYKTFRNMLSEEIEKDKWKLLSEIEKKCNRFSGLWNTINKITSKNEKHALRELNPEIKQLWDIKILLNCLSIILPILLVIC
nr:unnamed protein product [Callosobruchus analis]